MVTLGDGWRNRNVEELSAPITAADDCWRKKKSITFGAASVRAAILAVYNLGRSTLVNIFDHGGTITARDLFVPGNIVHLYYQ